MGFVYVQSLDLFLDSQGACEAHNLSNRSAGETRAGAGRGGYTVRGTLLWEGNLMTWMNWLNGLILAVLVPPIYT
jgi:hypothetical protein